MVPCSISTRSHESCQSWPHDPEPEQGQRVTMLCLGSSCLNSPAGGQSRSLSMRGPWESVCLVRCTPLRPPKKRSSVIGSSSSCQSAQSTTCRRTENHKGDLDGGGVNAGGASCVLTLCARGEAAMIRLCAGWQLTWSATTWPHLRCTGEHRADMQQSRAGALPPVGEVLPLLLCHVFQQVYIRIWAPHFPAFWAGCKHEIWVLSPLRL